MTINDVEYPVTTSRVWVNWNERALDEAELRQAYEAEKVKSAAIAQARIAAAARAKALLEENLSAAQRDELAKARYFTVHSHDAQREYRITHGRAGNVLLFKDGRAVKKFCIHPAIACPDEDTMLAQKLLLETDEKEFLRIANHTTLLDGNQVAPEYLQEAVRAAAG
jgi:hypothetical protein